MTSDESVKSHPMMSLEKKNMHDAATARQSIKWKPAAVVRRALKRSPCPGDAAQPTNHDARNAEEGSFQTHLHTNHPAHFVQREEVRTAAAAAYVAGEIPPVMAAATEYPSESRQHEDAGNEGRNACTRHAQRRNAQFAVYQDVVADDVQDVCRYHDVHGRAGVRDAVSKLLEGIEQHDEH